MIIRQFKWLFAAQSPIAAIAQTLVSRIAILAINLGTGVIVARSLGPSGRGAAAAMSLWPIVLCGVSNFGVPTALRYYVRRNPESGNDLFSVSILLAALSGFVAMIAGVLAVPHLLLSYSGSMIRFAVFMMLFAPQIMINNVLQAFLESQGDFSHANKMQYLPPAATLLALLILRQMHALNPYSVPLAYFVPTVFVTLWTACRLRRNIRLPNQIIERARHILHYGLRAYGLNVLATLSGQIDQAIIIGFMSASSFGLYGVALNIAAMLGIFATSLNVILFPRASELDSASAIAIVCRSARSVFMITTVGYLVLMPILPFAIVLIYGNAFVPDVALTRILMLEVLLSATTGTLSQAFMATGRPGMVTILQAIGLCITFPLMLVLIPRFGLTGAGIALVASATLRFVLLLLCFPLVLHQRIPTLLPTRNDVLSVWARLSRLGA